jgi:hypothetical protein
MVVFCNRPDEVRKVLLDSTGMSFLYFRSRNENAQRK